MPSIDVELTEQMLDFVNDQVVRNGFESAGNYLQSLVIEAQMVAQDTQLGTASLSNSDDSDAFTDEAFVNQTREIERRIDARA